MSKSWPVKLEVDSNSILHNIQEIKKHVGDAVSVMPVIKDEGYKTGINNKLDIYKACSIIIVGVAIVDEAVRMREEGYTDEIFVLNQIYASDIENVKKYNVTIGVGDISFLKELGSHADYNFKIHIEIDTGMGRTGVRLEHLEEYIAELKKYSNITVEGIYTHFSCSDTDKSFTNLQIEKFNEAIKVCESEGFKFKYIHACNSAGIIDFKEAWYNLVRPGIILYGYYPDENLKGRLDLKPALKLKSKISYIKTVPVGTSISYGRKYVTDSIRKIATVQLGYADGLRRSMTNKGKVVINGKIVPMVGTICMDCFMVDVTDIESVEVGDSVYIWDNENISVEDVADIYGTINYEVISTISDRVVREYI